MRSVLLALVVAALFATPAASAAAAPSVPVGSPMWRLVPVPGPDGSPVAAFQSPQLACPSATYCQILTSLDYLTTVSHGTATTVVAPRWDTDPHNDEFLYSIACVRPGSCVAPGGSGPGPWEPPTGFREELRDGTWAPEDSTAAYQDIDCNADRCVEIGTVDAGIDRGVLADRATGGSWVSRGLTTPWQGPGGAGFSIGLGTVDCPPSGPCYVLGHALDAQYESHSLLFYRDGSGWRGVPLAGPPGAAPGSAGANLLSCPAARTCMAFGTYSDQSTGTARLFAEIFDHGVLSAAPIPLPAAAVGAGVYPDALSCATIDDCAALYAWRGPQGGYHEIMLRYHAGTWSSRTPPVPVGAARGHRANVAAVACPGPSRCVAVGSYERATADGVVQRPAVWNSWLPNQWTAQAVPKPAGLPSGSGALYTLSCPDTTRCFVGGEYADKAVYGFGNLSDRSMAH